MRDLALPVLAGVLLALSFPPARLLVPVFVALVPLLLYIVRQPPGADGRWSATRGGIATGLVYFGLQLYWIAVALLRYSLLAIPAYLGVVLVLAGLTGAFAWAVHYTRERLRLPLTLQAAVFWTLLEWIQAHLGDLSFPWLGLAAALTPFPTLAGAADLVGARGLTFWIAGVNGLIASSLLPQSDRRPTTRPLRARLANRPIPAQLASRPIPARLASRPLPARLASRPFLTRLATRPSLTRLATWRLLTLLLVILIPPAYGVVRGSTLEMRPAARVALVQPDIPEDVKLGPMGLDSSLAALTRLTFSLDGRDLDMIAWPEVALPVDFLATDRLQERVRALSDRVGTPILVGAYGTDLDHTTRFNSAFLVEPGPPPAPAPIRYDKRRLVPFIERMPFGVRPPFTERAGEPRRTGESRRTGDLFRLGQLGRGGDPAVVQHPAAGAFGILICYESIFADLARDYRSAGADYLVNMTNDAWYGRQEWWGRTTALWQHPAHMVLRAIETRTGVARVANTGISMFVDPRGRTYRETPLFEPTVTEAVVYTTDVTTLFVRWGDWWGRLVAVFGVMAVLVARIR